MAANCAICQMGLDHCHGLVIEHDGDLHECTEGCGGGLLVHDEVVSCAELGLGCCSPLVLEDPAIPEPLVPAA